MRSTFYGLEIAKTGLFISQNQLDVTGHNILNVDTPGYTRQRPATSAIPAGPQNAYIGVEQRGTSGRGVETICVEQALRESVSRLSVQKRESHDNKMADRANNI